MYPLVPIANDPSRSSGLNWIEATNTQGFGGYTAADLQLRGSANVQTTMIYTRVARKNKTSVISPMKKMSRGSGS